ncbi:MAG: collagen-like protein [Flavobacterium sp.]
MKKITLFIAFIGMIGLQGCTGPQGAPGTPGQNGQDGLLSQVIELQNVNFGYDSTNGYTIYRTLSPSIYVSDNILVYRLTGTINSSTPIWQLIPRTLYLTQGDLDYDYDFSKIDFSIYAGGTYNLALTPTYINNQTFRIVILPGYFINKSKQVDTSNYNEVIKAYNIDDSNPTILK